MENLLISGVHFYRRLISPGLLARCHYYPTCSQYMIDIIHTHGSIKGTMMGVARTLRCHPFAKGGTDYVPSKFRLTKSPDETYHGLYTYRRNKKTGVEEDGRIRRF